MKARRSTLWTIHQLGDEVARALAVGYAGTSNGRVRDVPDLRTIRYYTTLGLLDRPAEMRGERLFTASGTCSSSWRSSSSRHAAGASRRSSSRSPARPTGCSGTWPERWPGPTVRQQTSRPGQSNP